MGLLDDISGQGLLAMLRNNALNQDTNTAGLPSDQANYGAAPFALAPPMQTPMPGQPPTAQANPQPSPMDGAQWPTGPVGAPSNAMAAAPPPMALAGPAAAPAAAPPPSASPPPTSPTPFSMGGPGSSIADRLAKGGMGFLGNLQNGPIGAVAGGLGALITGRSTDPGSIAAEKTSATDKALQLAGVDPVVIQATHGNPELLKTVITQKFGPKTVSSMGEGWYADKDGNIKRAYVPEDKTPSGFEKAEDGNMHFVPGGPADPAYLRLAEAQKKDPSGNYVLGKGGEILRNNPDGSVAVIHKNTDGAEATLDDDTAKAMAAQYLAGDPKVMQNLGRGAQGAANIVKIRTEIYKQAGAQGLDGKGIVNNFNEQAGALAGQRAVGTRAANISLAANEANNMIPIALDASDKLPRTQWMPWNQAVQAYQKGSSSPELASFVAATNSLVNSYVRAVSPNGVPTDSMRQHAYDMLNAAQGPGAYKAVVATMQKEMGAALQAPSQVRQELRTGNAAPPTQPPGNTSAGFQDGDVAHNPQTGETIVRKGGKWVPAQ